MTFGKCCKRIRASGKLRRLYELLASLSLMQGPLRFSKNPSNKSNGRSKRGSTKINGAKVNGFSRFYLELLKRQVLLLSDICLLLQITSKTQLISVFILFRCLLDDFILLLYVASKGYDEEVLIAYNSKMFSEHFKSMRESRDFNHKYFEGKRSGMYNEQRGC